MTASKVLPSGEDKRHAKLHPKPNRMLIMRGEPSQILHFRFFFITAAESKVNRTFLFFIVFETITW